MPIIGNPIYQSAFVVDQFSGDGTTVAFTMSVAPAGVTNVLVAVSGVLQDPSTYGVVGNTITFSAAPPSGTGNISCRYLGVPASGVTTTAYRTVTEFTATASQTTFTPPSYNVGFINVYLNGVLLGSADYTATNGTTVVLATGASAGNLLTVESFQISSVANAIPNAAGAVSSSNIQTSVILTTPTLTTPTIAGNGLINASWTTAGRPAAPVNGQQGYNTTLGQFEIYQNGAWTQYPPIYSIEYLVIAGGGGGGGVSSGTSGGGAGGAGGVLSSSTFVTGFSAFAVTVGAGGAGGAATANASSAGVAGSNSVFAAFATSIGGGRGCCAGAFASSDPALANGGAGGSGGGGCGGGTGNHPGGSGTSGQGTNGGDAITTGPNYGSGGGGGAISAGGAGTNTAGGNGGGATSAFSTWASATSTGVGGAYAGGGGGGTYQGGTPGSGGGGGATAGQTNGTAVTNATANTGSGGGGQGGGPSSAGVGANGGSGIVIIRYLGSQRGTGGTVTSSGGYTYHTFTSSGTYTA